MLIYASPCGLGMLVWRSARVYFGCSIDRLRLLAVATLHRRYGCLSLASATKPAVHPKTRDAVMRLR